MLSVAEKQSHLLQFHQKPHLISSRFIHRWPISREPSPGGGAIAEISWQAVHAAKSISLIARATERQQSPPPVIPSPVIGCANF
jgi:hypothetical protein